MRDDENRVVAGNGADNLRQPRAIERHAEELGLTRPRAQQHHLLHAVHARQVVDERTLKHRGRRRLRWSCLPRSLIGAIGASLYESELADVARQRRLRDVEPLSPDAPPQLLLTPD